MPLGAARAGLFAPRKTRLVTPSFIKTLTNTVNNTQTALAPLPDGASYAIGRLGIATVVEHRRLSDGALLRNAYGGSTKDLRALSVSGGLLYAKAYGEAYYHTWNLSSFATSTATAWNGAATSHQWHVVDPNGAQWRDPNNNVSTATTSLIYMPNSTTNTTVGGLASTTPGGTAITKDHVFRLTGSTLYVYERKTPSTVAHVATHTLGHSFIGGYATLWVDEKSGILGFPVSATVLAFYRVMKAT